MLYQTLKDEVLKYFASRTRFWLLCIALMFCIIGLRLVYLQVFKYDHFLRLSENNRIRELRVRPDRGFIKDRNGLILVRNAPGYELEIVKEDTKDLKKLLDDIDGVVSIDKAAVLRRIRQSDAYESIRVTRGLNQNHLSYFMEYSSDFRGIQIVVAPIRSYLDGTNLSHLLGYLGEVSKDDARNSDKYKAGDIIGRTGIENQYDAVLRGKDGRRRVEVDSFVRVVEVLHEVPPIPGSNILLTVDYRLQEHTAKLFEGKKGAVVVLDGKDHSVLAMYSAPAYDLNLFTPFIRESDWSKLRNDSGSPLLNRTIEGAYPPGSVYKILMATAGLIEGVVDTSTTYICNGYFKTSPKSSIIHRCWKRTGHGEVNLNKALKVSCDVYFYNLGMQLGIEKMYEYSNIFSLGRLTGINLPNEKTGIFPSKEWKIRTQPEGYKSWNPGDTVNTSIGQGFVTVTPLQMAVMVSSIFNGGTVYVPRIVDSVENPVTGEKTREPVYISSKMIVPESVRSEIMKGMVASVEERGGTAVRGRIHGFHYGGKTGTAQVVALKVTEGMNDADIPDHWRDHSWYAGVFPAESPRYTVVVMVENGGSGGRVSTPIGAAIISKMLELGYASNN